MANFLEKTSDALNIARRTYEDAAETAGVPSNFLARENKNRSLTSMAEVLLNTIDRTAQRSYVGSGFSNISRTRPNIQNVITQSPEAIVVIKKKIVSSLADNYSGITEMLNDDEIQFIRASKKLFENKCIEISNYEKLTKLNSVLNNVGTLTSPIAQAIYEVVSNIEATDFNKLNGYDGVIDSSSKILSFGTGIIPEKVLNQIKANADIIKKIKGALKLNGFEQTTTWLKTNNKNVEDVLGDGIGTIELTMVTNIQTRCGLNLGEGSCSFMVSDPYHILFITEVDIEKAIFQTSYKRYSVFNTTANFLEEETLTLQNEINASRASRNASKLSFSTNIHTRVYNKVLIILDALGVQVTNDDGTEFYKDLSVDEFNALKLNHWSSKEKFTADEYNTVIKIYDNMLRILQLKMSDYENYKDYNYKSNYVRKLMYKHYMGRQLIQPMDVVNIFIDSKTVEDKLILAGLGQTFLDYSNPLYGKNSIGSKVSNIFGSSNFASLLDKTFGATKSLFSGTTKDNSMSFKERALKNTVVGEDFPAWLWNVLRTNFTSNDFGTCTFVGVVDNVSEDYNDGAYKLSVSCKDNGTYFEQGYYNAKPGVYQFNGHLYDPLTAFDFEYDQTTGLLPELSEYKLLPENEELLKSGCLRLQDGKNAGEVATVETYNDVNIEPKVGLSKLKDTYSNLSNRIYTDPDGFTYRWKRGIGTAIVNQSGTRDGLMSGQAVQEDVAQVVTEDPFAGQDLVNVISILVCGEPYNFDTFYKAASQYGAISFQSNYSPETDYFQGLFKRIKKQNKLWGDFVPFKKMTSDPTVFSTEMALQSMHFSRSTAIKKKQQEKSALINKLIQLENCNKSFDPSVLQSIAGRNTVPEIQTSNMGITLPLIKKILELDTEQEKMKSFNSPRKRIIRMETKGVYKISSLTSLFMISVIV